MRASALDSFIRETIADHKAVGVVGPSATFTRRLEKILRSDYRTGLRRLFAPDEARALVAAGSRIAWPLLNQKQVPFRSLRTYVKLAANRGITLMLGKQATAKTLLGFYLPTTLGLRRPVIWVNTAVKHRAIMAAAVAHETGHHIARQVLGEASSRRSGLHAHRFGSLNDRDEIAADFFVSIGGIPHPMAVQMFGQPDGDPDRVRKACQDLFRRYEIDLPLRGGDEAKLILLGLCHYLKLREALLTEFDL